MLTLTPPVIRLVETIAPDLGGDVLVLGGCQTDLAAKVAPYADQIILVCFDQADTQKAQAALEVAGASSVTIATHLPDQLTYAAQRFAAILCLDGSERVAQMEAWLLKLGRIIKPGGSLLLRSHLVPGSRLHGKRARLQREAGGYINAFCRLRSAGHRRYYSQDQWEDLLEAAGLQTKHIETADVSFDLSTWAGACSRSQADFLRLKAMLIQAPEKAHEFLTPQIAGDRIRFRLPEITILATSQVNLGKHGQSERTANLTRQVD